MFLMIGVNDRQEVLDFRQLVFCENCGRESTVEVYKIYRVLTLFFLPVFRWNVRYYARMSCCGSVIELSGEQGKQIEEGYPVYIDPESFPHRLIGRCPNCGYEVDPDDLYCAHCGTRLR